MSGSCRYSTLYVLTNVCLMACVVILMEIMKINLLMKGLEKKSPDTDDTIINHVVAVVYVVTVVDTSRLLMLCNNTIL